MSREYAPPFATLASVQNAGGAYTRDATISLAITPSLSIKHDSIVICRWGVEAKRKASPNARRRDPPNASSRLTSVEGRESRVLHFNGRQPNGLNKNNISVIPLRNKSSSGGGGGGLMRGIKIPQQDFALKMPGGAYARGGAYLQDTTVLAFSTG